VGPKKTLFLDEISTGLDSSTTFQITRTLRDFSHLRQATMLVALLQPTPETYNLFDDILLMSEGKLGIVESNFISWLVIDICEVKFVPRLQQPTDLCTEEHSCYCLVTGLVYIIK